MKKLLIALILIASVLLSLCSCKGDVVEDIPTVTSTVAATRAPTSTPVPIKEIEVDINNAREFDNPIVIKDIKNKYGRNYYYSFSEENTYAIVEDDNSIIVRAEKEKEDGNEYAICKFNVEGNIEWEYLINEYVESLFVRDNTICVFVNNGEAYSIIKLSLDGKLLGEKDVFDGDGDVKILSSDDGFIVFSEKPRYMYDDEFGMFPSATREDFEFPYAAIKKIDFDGKEIWQRYYNGSLDVEYGKFFVNDDGVFCFKQKYSADKDISDRMPIYLPDEERLSEEERIKIEDELKHSSAVEYENEKDEITIVKLTSDGYFEEEKDFESEIYVSDECVLLDKRGLLGTSGIDDDKGNEFFELINYNLNGKYTWKTKNFVDIDNNHYLEIPKIIRRDNYICLNL